MTKKRIKEMDAIKNGVPCTAAIVRGGLTVARIDKGVFCQRREPVVCAWGVITQTRNKKITGILYITPRDNVVIFENNHFRIDI